MKKIYIERKKIDKSASNESKLVNLKIKWLKGSMIINKSKKQIVKISFKKVHIIF